MSAVFLRKVTKAFKIAKNIVYCKALLQGVAAAVEHEKLLKTLSCALVVDIGANRGQFALVARYCFPEARIISFEPLTEPARLFQEIFSNDDLVSLYPFAIGPKSKPALIHLSDKDDSSSLLPITPLQTILFPGTDEKDIRTIPEQPLNAHLSDNDIVPPAMLKLDVQGYELQVLKGCVDLLSSFNYIYVECSFVELYLGQALADEVIAFLYEQNFRLNGIHNIKYDQTGLAIQADFFFRHIGN